MAEATPRVARPARGAGRTAPRRAGGRAARGTWRTAGRVAHGTWRTAGRVARAMRPRLRRWLPRLVLLGGVAAALAVITTLASVTWVRSGARRHVFTEETVPAAPVALVLGTQVYDNGEPSAFLVGRLEVARRLLAAGKVRALLVSGDHMKWEYNEPGTMLRWLIDRGVPRDKVVLDHAGFDTYDSCARANRVFGVRKAIIVTQTYHVARAVVLCRRLGVEADGVGDDSVRRSWPWKISATREHGACVKAVYDVVSGRDPVFLGQRETGVDEALRS